ncbi:exocrine gland-secreted peptide 1-like [Rattus rattus]|uniref:exocrine gland-secreted peptide 1-like n=1 Tax=Rattus rattus TaxID=10117 RepID=UPI0013F37E72|nr:exocrine gland-secreted peptide 1-like [Rattus rattus]
MAPLQVMLFLITLLFPLMSTEGRVLPQTQTESTISSTNNTNHKAALDKTDCQGEGNIQGCEKVFCASNQEQILCGDVANANQHKLNLSQNMMSQRTCCTQNHQVDHVYFNYSTNRLQGTRVRDHEINSTHNVISYLDKYLESVKEVLLFRYTSLKSPGILYAVSPRSLSFLSPIASFVSHRNKADYRL